LGLFPVSHGNWFFLQLIVSDFFLGKQMSENGFVTIPLQDEFMENARLFIFET
jgi:translation initiation factor 3 subunit E